MMARVDVEWRKGADGTGGTYLFNPRPNITRPKTGQKHVEFKIPLATGSLTQLLGKDSDTVVLRGVLVEPDPRYDQLDKKRRELIDGIGTGAGQLHVISNLGTPDSKHIFYKGLPRQIEFSEQTNSQLLEYRIDLLLSDPTEFIV